MKSPNTVLLISCSVTNLLLVNGFGISQNGWEGLNRARCLHGNCQSSALKTDASNVFLSARTHWKQPSSLQWHYTAAGAFFAIVMLGVCFGWIMMYCPVRKALHDTSKTSECNPETCHEFTSVEQNPTAGGILPQLHDAVSHDQSLSDLITYQAALRPEKGAILDADGSICLTYSMLVHKASKLAAMLSKAGLVEGDIVAFLLGPSCALVVASIASIHAKLIWAPLDAASPIAWRQEQLARMGARLQLAAPPPEQLSPPSVPIWCLGPLGDLLGDTPKPGPTNLSASSPQAPACTSLIIHTSGSTGKPKGVCYSKNTLLHGVLTFVHLCKLDSESVALLKTPATWAVVEYELFPALVVGGSIVVDHVCQKDLKHLAQVLLQRSVTTLVTSAGVLRGLVEDFWSPGFDSRPKLLQHVVNVGAGIPMDLCAAVHEVLGDAIHVSNAYGCTETPVCTWTYSRSAGKASSLAPAGRPQPDVDVYVLDKNFEQVHPGQDGEVCFCGHFLSSGYLGNKAATDERFLPHPFGDGLMYRTGDLGRWDPDPADPSKLALRVVGRLDRQTNIRGLRVSPEDVEVVIKELSAVGEVAVVAAAPAGQEQCLVACVAPDVMDLERSVKDHCFAKLPQHMRPTLVLCFKELPKLQNGKIDLRSLADKASACVESEPLTADSLGVMRKAGKDTVRQLSTMSASRGVAMIAVILYHWYWYPVHARTTNIPRPPDSWIAGILLGAVIALSWSMHIFALQSGFQDRLMAESNATGQWRGDLLIFLLLLATNGPIRWCLNLVCSMVNETPNVEAYMPFRWYLTFYLACRALSCCVFAPCEARVRKFEAPVVVRACPIFIILIFAGLSSLGDFTMNGTPLWRIPNLCHGFLQNSPVVHLMGWILPSVNESELAEPAYCPLLPHVGFLRFLVSYVAAWWYGKDIVHQVRKLPWIANLGALPAAGIFIVMSMSYFAIFGKFEASNVKAPHIFDTVVNIFFSGLLFLACALADQQGFLFRVLAFIGRYSLGGYVFHLYLFGWQGLFSFYGLGADSVPSLLTALEMVQRLPGSHLFLPQFLVMLCYVVIAMVVFCAPFQVAITESLNHTINAVSWLSLKWQHSSKGSR